MGLVGFSSHSPLGLGRRRSDDVVIIVVVVISVVIENDYGDDHSANAAADESDIGSAHT